MSMQRMAGSRFTLSAMTTCILFVLGVLFLAGWAWLALRKPPVNDRPTSAPDAGVERSADYTPRAITPEPDSVKTEVLVTPPATEQKPVKATTQPAANPPDTVPQSVPVATAGATNSLPRSTADLYREAFEVLQGLSENERNLLWDLSTNAVSPELWAKIQPAIELLHQTTTKCDWGERVDRDASQDYLLQYQALHKVLLWSAAHCREGDPDGLRDDLQAALRAGSNFAVHPFVQDQNTMLQGRILDFLAERAPSLPATTLAELSDTLVDGSYEMSFYRAMGQHAKNLESDAANGENTNPARAAESGMDAAEYRDWLRRLLTTSVIDGIPTANVSDIHPNHWNDMVKWTQSMSVRRVMTAAALQVLIADSSVLTQYPDPSTGQPFQCQATETGFALTSGALLNGKPVTMNFADLGGMTGK